MAQLRHRALCLVFALFTVSGCGGGAGGPTSDSAPAPDTSIDPPTEQAAN